MKNRSTQAAVNNNLYAAILESMNSFDAENDLFHIAYIMAPEKAANIISKIGESFFLAKCL